MTVITLSKCPPSLRGDLTKWLFEIETGVYVGKVSARVRDELWDKIGRCIKDGRAVAVFNAKNEQGLDFRTINTKWEPVDYDGLKLMMRSLPVIKKRPEQKKASRTKTKTAKIKTLKKHVPVLLPDSFAVLDLETTGLDNENDRIIEIGALLVQNHAVTSEFQCLVSCENKVPENIIELTGITDEMLMKGVTEKEAVNRTKDFIKDMPIVAHNVLFDLKFFNSACLRNDIPVLDNPSNDTLKIARKCLKEVENYRLDTLISYFGIEVKKRHRAIPDCYITFELFEKLNKLL